MNRYLFWRASAIRRDGNCAGGGINRFDESAYSVALPFRAIARLLIRNVGLLHRDDGSRLQLFAVGGCGGANEDAITSFEIGKGKGRGFLQVLLAGLKLKKFGGVSDGDDDFGASIGF